MNFITDLAVILIAAGVFTVVARALKQPLILGYIVAGFLVGPHLGLVPITSEEGVHQWSEIGIIFLLFSLGLEFSFKKLMSVGGSALVTALVKCIGMFAVGMMVGELLDWTTMECIFLGGLLSMSSTTIIIKAYDDMGLKNRPHAPLLFGSLVFEDLLAVLLMVLLSTIAVSNKVAPGEMVMALGKLGFFLVLWFLVGIYLIPTLLRWTRRFLNSEIMLILAVGLCFMMVALAELAGFSSALGAFVMGSILAETIEGERIERSLGSIRDLFGAIFFVSVGMMVDPHVIALHWAPIVVLTVATMVGILVFSTAGPLLMGEGLKNSLHVGFSLTQLGEFAFIIAGLGCSLGVMRDFIYPVIIAVSVVTTFFTPYMIKAADPVSDWLYRVLPPRLVARLDPFDRPVIASSASKNEWRRLLRTVATYVLLYSVVIIAIIIFSSLYAEKLALRFFPNVDRVMLNLVLTIATVVLIAPFLVGLTYRSHSEQRSVLLLLSENRRNRFPIMAITILRHFMAIMAVAVVININYTLSYWVLILMAVVLVALILSARLANRRMAHFERQFLSNLNAREEYERSLRPVTTAIQDKLASYDVHVETFKVPVDFDFAGLTLREMPFRHHSGVNVIKITRGTHQVVVPSGDVRIFPGDDISIVGTSDQIAEFKTIMEENTHVLPVPQVEFTVVKGVVSDLSPLAGRTLRQSDMRKSGCMVVSLFKSGQMITNPGPDEIIEVGNTVWIAGEKKSCQWFLI
ncbi:MAG: cation:proton antiporter [Bacteroidales bacterium]|nr:cation:proton antiporter [Bacteroidales bacterium]